jgi:hypothetical protein
MVDSLNSDDASHLTRILVWINMTRIFETMKRTQRRYSAMMDFAQAQQSNDPGLGLSVQGSFARLQQTKANKMSSSPVVLTIEKRTDMRRHSLRFFILEFFHHLKKLMLSALGKVNAFNS